ncbi:trigger factor [Bernardetia sp.]|uniref:trigger factor n=1 Tax=Bernardetia sp. TaxID=1937974 RepID=UPI0025C0CFEA|nr:trigger factor [Bernardetia sp.]
MEIKLEKKNETNAFIHVSVKEEDYKAKFDKKLEDYRKQASIKGFRPGKAPMSLVKKMIGKEVRMDEVNDVVTKGVSDYIQEEKLDLLGAPIPQPKDTNWSKEKEFEFSYEIGLVPDFDYDISENVKADNYKIDITTKEVDNYIDNLRSRFGSVENPEESEKGDFVYGEIFQMGKDEEGNETKTFSVETLIPTNKIADSQVEKFVGVKGGDNFTFDMAEALPNEKERGFALGIETEDAAKLSGEFTMVVESITRRIPAPLDEEFFKKIGAYKPAKPEPVVEGEEPKAEEQEQPEPEVMNEEEFREEILNRLKEDYAKEAEALTDIYLRRNLIENTKIDLPDEFLKRWLAFANEGKFTAEQIEEEYPEFVKEMKWSLIQNRILKDKEVEITREDIIAEARKEVQNMMMRMGGGMQLPESQMDSMAESFLQADNGKHYQQIATQAMRQRSMEAVRESVTLNDKVVTEEEFAEIAESLNTPAK